MFFEFKSGTARLEIHYVDLAVSKALEATVEDWYRGLVKRSITIGTSTLRRVGPSVPTGLRALLLLSALSSGYLLTVNQVTDSKSLLGAGVSIFGAVAVTSLLGVPIANQIKKLIDRSAPSSAVILSKVDEELVLRSSRSGWTVFGKMLFSVIGAITLGVASAYIGKVMGID